MPLKKTEDFFETVAGEIRAFNRIKKKSQKKRRKNDIPAKVRALRGFLPASFFDTAYYRLGDTASGRKLLSAAAIAYAKGKKAQLLRKAQESLKLARKMESKGLSKEQISRVLVKKNFFKGYDERDETYRPARKNRFRGKWEHIRDGKRVKYVSYSEAGRGLKRIHNEKVVRKVAIDLQMSMREVRGIYADMRRNIRSALRRFKKTKIYKSLTPRQKRSYTFKRWFGGVKKAFYDLANVTGSP